MSPTFSPKRTTVREFFSEDKKYYIPDYQRAYSWKEKQLKQWLDDLRNVTKSNSHQLSEYYLGRILLEKSGGSAEYAVTDGQQRLTTTLLFLSAARAIDKKVEQDSYEEYFEKLRVGTNRKNSGTTDQTILKELLDKKRKLLDRDGQESGKKEQRFLKIREGYRASTDSQELMIKARLYFEENITKEEVSDLCETLLSANLITVVIGNKQTATLIFQLENDRGTSLTNMENLKSFLMYKAMLFKTEETEETLNKITDLFNEIGKIAFKIKKERPDTVLLAHYRAFLTPEWQSQDEDERYTGQYTPYRSYSLEEIEKKLDESFSENESNAHKEIIMFTKKLKFSFKAIQDLEEKPGSIYGETFKYLRMPEYALPFVLVEYSHCNNEFNDKRINRLLKILAKLVLRQESVAYIHSGTNITQIKKLGGILQNFRKNDSLKSLDESINFGLKGGWRVENLGRGKESHLWRHDLFNKFLDGGRYPDNLSKFFLFQYEKRELSNPLDLSKKWTLEHISPQSKQDYDEAKGHHNKFGNYAAMGRGKGDKEYSAIHNRGMVYDIGNLCLIERDDNSSASNKPFSEKLKNYKRITGIKHLKEVIKIAEKHKSIWGKEAIEERRETLAKWIQGEYGFKKTKKKKASF